MVSKVPRLALRAAGIVCLVLVAAGAVPAEAQSNFMVYRAKFTCGFAGGNIPDSGSAANVLPVPYREVQPGNYSTVINILNSRLNGQTSEVDIFIFVQGRPTASLPDLTLETFTTSSHARIDCDDITSALAADGFQADGRFVEGFIMLRAQDESQNEGSELEVSAVYTYGSRRTDGTGTGLGSSIEVERIEGKPEVQPE
jgi:hypothetical protein